MASLQFEDTPATYHPLFNSEDADITLRSSAGTLYRVSSFTLRNTSGFFDAMLSLPQTDSAGQSSPIPVNEKSEVLEKVLRMMSGLEITPWESFDELEDVASLAERWDAPGPLSIIRSGISAPLFLEQPLRLYAIATHFDWQAEAKLASKFTLSLSLFDESHRAVLHKIPSKSLMDLLRFHRQRRDQFKHLLDNEETFNVGNTDLCCQGCGTPIDNHTWRELKGKMFMEIDKRPLGDTICGFEMESWQEALACWDAKCKKEGCGTPYYQKVSTLRNIQACLERLPNTI